MPSYGMLRRVTLVRTDVSEERIETSVLTRVTRRNIPEDGILCSHHRESLKLCIVLTLIVAMKQKL
jgi:hypothetical protein